MLLQFLAASEALATMYEQCCMRALAHSKRIDCLGKNLRLVLQTALLNTLMLADSAIHQPHITAYLGQV